MPDRPPHEPVPPPVPLTMKAPANVAHVTQSPPVQADAAANPPGQALPTAPPLQPWVWAHQARPHGRHTTTTLVLSVVAALVGGIMVGGGTVGVIWAVQADAPASAAPSPAHEEADDQAAQLAEDVLPGELDRLLEFVEKERGLEFTDEVEVQFLDDAGFADAWFAPPPGYEAPDGPADYGSTYAALGLTPSPDDYYEAEQTTSLGGLMGFYDPETGELAVRGSEWTPMVEATVVHELTHALQDQHFDLSSMIGWTGSEADLAARALIEGDANRIEIAYYIAQDADWQQAYDDGYNEIHQDAIASGPYDPLLEMLGSMPYWLGDMAVTELAAQGNAHVDTALREPPTTTAEVVEINRFVRGEISDAEPPDAPPAPADAEILDEGTLGVAFLELLHLDVQTDWFGYKYLTGWRGDKYVTWAEGDGACTAVTIKLEAMALGRADDYFEPWADRTGGTIERLEDKSGVTLSSCAEW